MNGWDGVRAWCFIRASGGYRKAWRRYNPPPGLPEQAPFPVRLQTGVDLAALEWGLFAWEDPYAERPLAPFWACARMSDGMVTPSARSLAALAAEGGAALAGLRIGDGSLILKIERNGAAAQVRIPGGAAFPADGGLSLVREVARIEDVWSGVPVPWRGRGTGIATGKSPAKFQISKWSRKASRGLELESNRFRHDDGHPRPFPRKSRRIEEFRWVGRVVAGPNRLGLRNQHKHTGGGLDRAGRMMDCARALSANITETPATFGISVGRRR